MIKKPLREEYPDYTVPYINQISERENILEKLAANAKETADLVRNLNEEQLLFRYAEGKWTIKEILVHIMDAERVFT